MNIPDKIRVGGHKYKVLKDYNFTERYDFNAQCSHDSCEIRLGQGYRENCKSRRELIFLHEVIHAIDAVYNGAQLKESDVENLGEGLYQTLKDNKIF